MKSSVILLASMLCLAHPSFGRADDFAKVVDDYFAARFRDRPSEGTAAGLHQYDPFLEDLSKTAVDKRVVELKDLQRRLNALDVAKLSFDDSIDARFLEGQIKAELLDLDVLKPWESNPMSYAGLAGGAIDGLMKRDFAPAAAFVALGR